MKVVFRVDASVYMGTGHLIRSLTLAEVLRQRGAEVRFVCREHFGNLITLLREKDIPVAVLPAPAETESVFAANCSTWLGVTQADDAYQTIATLTESDVDCLIVDHYGLDAAWELQVRPYVKKLMVIDDLANRHHHCDVLLDQNFSDEREPRYSGLVPRQCRLLAGPRFALLDPEYASNRKRPIARDGVVRTVFVYFGGSDPQNMTGLALDALSRPEFRHLKVDVVVGANNPNRKELFAQVVARGGVQIFGMLPNLAGLMMQADLAIGAGGTTTWERMCLGLPSVVISIADNQSLGAKALARAGLIDYAGTTQTVTADILTRLIALRISKPSDLVENSNLIQLHVDGLGAFRVSEVLFPTDGQTTTLRPAVLDDMSHFFAWANDSVVRANSHNSEFISWADHQVWFRNKMLSVDCKIYVLETDKLPIGQIRFDRVGAYASIDYSLDATVRGRNWGRILIKLGIEKIWNDWPIVRLRAEVKVTNVASATVFRQTGFSDHESRSADCLVFQKERDTF